MSRSPSTTWQAVETAPPRLIRIERRPSLEKRLETIEEESEGGHKDSCNAKPLAFNSSSKVDFSKQFPSLVAGSR
ncbi:hypothetical protein L1049_010825 [Liquidambar formosana]|uniref:Uncharacterized protein n=1 Tax=Liquidambar formosana TaxID=63359 RepID=A0AAP0WXP6_LIQFO